MRLAIVLLVALATPAYAGECRVPDVAPQPLFAGTVFTSDGGVVIGAVDDDEAGVDVDPTGDVAAQRAWRFRDGTKLLAPQIRTLAPGLALYTPPATSGDKLELVDGKGTRIQLAGRATGAKPVVVPPVTAIERTQQTAGRRIVTTVTARLAKGAPTGAAIVLIAYVNGAPIAWANLMRGTSNELVVLGSEGGCTFLVPGTVLPGAGTDVTFAFVDSTGRVSAQSKPVTVR